MDGNGRNEQQNLVDVGIAAVALNIGAHHTVQVGRQLVNEVQGVSACENTGDGNKQAPFAAVIQGRQNQTQHRRCQHDTRSKGQDNVAEFVRDVLENYAQTGADDGGTANAQGCEDYHTHRDDLLKMFL